MATQLTRFLTRSSQTLNSLTNSYSPPTLQQTRGIRVQVRNGNLEQALQMLQTKMRSSGMERLIKKVEPRHIKNSEKRVLARKLLQRKVESQDLARKLKSILTNKIRGL